MRNHCFAFVLAGSLALSPAGGLGAQDTVLVPIDTRVRVSAPSVQTAPVIVGTVQGLSGDVLSLRPAGSPKDTVLLLSLASVEKFEVSQGSTSHAGKWALTGLWWGAVLGAALGVAVNEAVASIVPLSAGDYIETVALLGGVSAGIGAGVGALLGGTLGRGYRWAEVAVDRVRVAVGPQHGSLLALSVSISF